MASGGLIYMGSAMMASPERHLRFDNKANRPISAARNRSAETALGHVEDCGFSACQSANFRIPNKIYMPVRRADVQERKCQ